MFTIIDTKTGREPDLDTILLTEGWAPGLCGSDIDQFFVGEDGTIALADDCGNLAIAPYGRFAVVLDNGTIQSMAGNGKKMCDLRKRVEQEIEAQQAKIDTLKEIIADYKQACSMLVGMMDDGDGTPVCNKCLDFGADAPGDYTQCCHKDHCKRKSKKLKIEINAGGAGG